MKEFPAKAKIITHRDESIKVEALNIGGKNRYLLFYDKNNLEQFLRSLNSEFDRLK